MMTLVETACEICCLFLLLLLFQYYSALLFISLKIISFSLFFTNSILTEMIIYSVLMIDVYRMYQIIVYRVSSVF